MDVTAKYLAQYVTLNSTCAPDVFRLLLFRGQDVSVVYLAGILNILFPLNV